MKKRLYLLTVLSLLSGTALMCQNPAKKLEVIYFHATRRCPTCLAIEQNTRKTLDTYFSNQLKGGTIKMTVINVDEASNFYNRVRLFELWFRRIVAVIFILGGIYFILVYFVKLPL